MKNLLQTIKKNSSFRLTAIEKERMRANLESYMELHPLIEKHSESPVSLFTIFNGSLFAKWAAPATLCTLLFFGGVAQYLEHGSTPSVHQNIPDVSPLYLTNMLTPQMKAKNNTLLLEQKLEEVESSFENPATLEEIEAIEESIDEHTEAVQQSIAQSEEEGDVKEAHEIGSRLQSKLGAHERILGRLMRENGHVHQATLQKVLERVQSEKLQTEEIRVSLVARLKGLEEDKAHTFVQELAAELDVRIEEVSALVGTEAEHDEARGYLEEAILIREQSADFFEEKQFAEAIEALLKALHSVQEAKATLDALEDDIS